jgi:hypothetical protein
MGTMARMRAVVYQLPGLLAMKAQHTAKRRLAQSRHEMKATKMMMS